MMPYDDEEARYSTPGVVGQGHVPGEYGYSAGNADEYGDEPENYIRYGRIPQRVPRRLKTIKRVEWVFFSHSSLHSLSNTDSIDSFMGITSTTLQFLLNSSLCARIGVNASLRY